MPQRNICSALLQREMTGKMSLHVRNRNYKRLADLTHHPPPAKRKRSQKHGPPQNYNLFEEDQLVCNNLLNIRRIRIDEVIPKHALQSGHIVMGFTHCNRYILTYTIRPAQQHHVPHMQQRQNENRPLPEFDVDALYTYKIYFWQFIPFSFAKKYSSTLLFDRNGIPDSNLVIQICQWKYESFSNDKFLVVVGRSSNPEENPRCYLTLTQLPPSSPCPKCIYSKLTPEYTQVLNPCQNHAITVALTYELVSPYPKFDPEVSLYLTDTDTPTILINTGNLLHQIQFNPSQLKQNKSNVLKTDLNQHHPELNYYYKHLIPPSCEAGRERRFFKRTKQVNTTTPTTTEDRTTLPIVGILPSKEKPDIYDLLNEDDCKIDKNYKLYRTRQLADKTYDTAFLQEICKYDQYVLRPLRNSNLKGRPQHRNSTNASSQQPTSAKTMFIKRCLARVTRSYVLLNEESVSTTTEVEDNDFNEYPVALPANVYTDQTQLSMIPNYKAVDKKVLITQTSLDFEIMSNEIANLICNKEGMRFAFLIDFDAVVVQTHPIDSTITVLIILLIQATTPNDDNTRLSYEANYIVQWNPAAQSSKILFKGRLKLSSTNKLDQVWNPTDSLRPLLKSTKLYVQGNAHLNNNQMVYDWISADEITDTLGVVTLYREKILHASPSTEDFDDDDIISLLSDD